MASKSSLRNYLNELNKINYNKNDPSGSFFDRLQLNSTTNPDLVSYQDLIDALSGGETQGLSIIRPGSVSKDVNTSDLNNYYLGLPSTEDTLQFAFPDIALKTVQSEYAKRLNERSAKQAELEAQRQKQLEEEVQRGIQERQANELNQKLDQAYKNAYDLGSQKITDELIPARQAAIAEEASLGRLRSPVSIATIGKIDQSRDRALSDLAGSLSTQRASGSVDIAKTIEGIIQNQNSARQQNSQFLQDLGLRRENLNQQKSEFDQNLAFNKERATKGDALTQKQLDLSSELGKITAQSSEPGVLDYLNTGLTGASTIGSLFGPGGAAGGALASILSKLNQKNQNQLSRQRGF